MSRGPAKSIGRGASRPEAAEAEPACDVEAMLAAQTGPWVYDARALEAAAASRVGDPATEHAVACDMPRATERWMAWWPDDDGAPDLLPRYPFRLGSRVMRHRRFYLAEHRDRLRRLEADP